MLATPDGSRWHMAPVAWGSFDAERIGSARYAPLCGAMGGLYCADVYIKEKTVHVAAILKQNGRVVITANPMTTLFEIATTLSNKRIGAIVIVAPNGTVDGIVSERDIISALSAQGPDSLKRSVSEIMIRDVVTCEEEDTVDEVMARMTSRRFRHLPVMRQGALVGIVSIGDVVKHHMADVTMEAIAMREYITHS